MNPQALSAKSPAAWGFCFMLKMGWVILASNILMGCQPRPSGQNIAPSFQPYFAEFQQEASFFGANPPTDNLSIQFGEPPVGEYGHCSWKEHRGIDAQGHWTQWKERKIVISQSLWDKDSEIGKQNLINHELGHCSYMRDHLNTTNPDIDSSQDPLPTSIMNGHNLWSLLKPTDLQKNWFYYLRELHTGRTDVSDIKELPFSTPDIKPPEIKVDPGTPAVANSN